MNFDLYSRLYLWLVAHRRLTLFLTLVVTLVCTVVSLQIRTKEDMLDMLPSGDERVEEYRYALRKFRQIDRVYMDIGINRDDPETLARAADAMYERLATNSAFGRIQYRVEMGNQDQIVSYLTGALPNLFTAEDARELEAKLQPEEVRDYLTTMRRKLAGPEGMVLKNVIEADPIGSSGLVVKKVLPLQAGFGGAEIVEGRITSSDGRHVLMLAEPKFPSSDSGASAELVREMVRAARDVEQQFPGVHVAITGGHRMSVDNATIIRADAQRCIAIGMVAMIVLFLFAYRRRWLAMVTFLPSFFGTTVAGVMLAIWHDQLSAIALGFASIAVGITVDYAIHVIYHLDDAGAADHPKRAKHLTQLVYPISVGVITTVAAFMVMLASPINGYRQLGMLGTVGVVFSAAFALIILPLLVPPAKGGSVAPLRLTGLWERFFQWQAKRRGIVVLIALVLTLVAVFGVRHLRFEGDITKMNGITDSTRADEALISKTWGDAVGMTLVVTRGETPAEALAQNDRLAAALAGNTNVTAVYSLAAICPAPETQRENMQRWREFWTVERRENLRQTLTQVAGELGFRADAFARFWQQLESEPELLTLEQFRGTPLEKALDERVALAEGDNAISTVVRLADRAQAGQLRELVPGAIVLDGKDFATHLAAIAKDGLKAFAVGTTIAVGILLAVCLASLELMAVTLVPIVVGLLWTFGAMAWLGLPIDLMNSIFVIFIIGVGEDYAVFLVTSRLDEWRGRASHSAVASASVFVSAATTIFGFGVMVLADHPVLFSMGATVLIGMLFTFVATLLLTPLCMDVLLFNPMPRGAPKWWHVLGTIWVTLHLGGIQVYLYTVLRPVLKLFRVRNGDAFLRASARYLVRGLIKAMPFGRTRLHDITPETFKKPSIVISNHQSAVDTLLVKGLPGDVRQTAKKRVFDSPLLGFSCKYLGEVMVEPNNPEGTLQRAREVLRSGASVHFYPEGTRSLDGSVQRFRRGAFELAVELKQEILPIVICDSNTAMPRDAFWFEPYRLTMRALPRITPENFDYSQGVGPLMKHCEEIVRAGLQAEMDRLNTPATVRRKIRRLFRYQGVMVEEFVKWKLKLDPVFSVLDEVVPRRAHVLDLGCGYGLATHWLAAFTDTRTFVGYDYDENKIRVAKRTAAEQQRIRFEAADVLTAEYPACDVVLLLDVLHYWTAEKQLQMLTKARQALRPGGRLVLRDGIRAETEAHQKVYRWERFATRVGMNRTVEGLHFQTQEELQTLLRQAGFVRWEFKAGAGKDSNVMLVASA